MIKMKGENHEIGSPLPAVRINKQALPKGDPAGHKTFKGSVAVALAGGATGRSL